MYWATWYCSYTCNSMITHPKKTKLLTLYRFRIEFPNYTRATITVNIVLQIVNLGVKSWNEWESFWWETLTIIGNNIYQKIMMKCAVYNLLVGTLNETVSIHRILIRIRTFSKTHARKHYLLMDNLQNKVFFFSRLLICLSKNVIVSNWKCSPDQKHTRTGKFTRKASIEIVGRLIYKKNLNFLWTQARTWKQMLSAGNFFREHSCTSAI